MRLFLFGFERSGTTLLSMMVGAHPDIAVPLSVTGLWFQYGEKLHSYNNLAGQSDLERIVDDLLAEERINLWDAEISRDGLLRDLPLGNYPAVVDRFLSLYAAAKGKSRWGVIDIRTLTDMATAHKWFPDARFLHIVRDGRDVAVSHETIPFGASNTWECADQWARKIDANIKMGAILGPSRYLTIRYEDLVLESEATLKKMCRFLDVPYSDGMLQFQKMVEEKIPEDRRWMWPLIRKPLERSRVGGWRRKMPPLKRKVFERNAGEMLKQFGYEDVSVPSRSPLVLLLELWQFLTREKRLYRFGRVLGIHRRSGLERDGAKQR